jgi:hypothetical protein
MRMAAHVLGRALRRSVALAALLALASSAPVFAQTQLYLLTSGSYVPNPECGYWDYGCEFYLTRNPGRVIRFDVDRRQIAASTPVSDAYDFTSGPRVTPDGRFLLWSGWNLDLVLPIRVSLFDVASRQQATPWAASIESTFVPLAVHPSEMRAYIQLSHGRPVTVAEPGHTRTLPLPPCGAPVFQTLSGDGRRLSYYCDSPRSVMVVDSGDGRLLGAVALGAPAYLSVSTKHVLDGPGTTMYTADMDNAFDGDPTIYRRFDVASGALLAERQGFEVATSLWAYNQMTGHLYVGNWSGIVVLDANTLAEIGRIASPHPALLPKVAFDPELPHAYIAFPRDNGRSVHLSLVDTVTLATLGSVEVPTEGGLVGLALGPRPPRVSGLNIFVVDRAATLSWASDTSHSIATGQVVEAGFTPGATDVRLPVAAGATSLTVPAVPPGRYYVRVRSVNGTGLGAPSNEVLVDVP